MTNTQERFETMMERGGFFHYEDTDHKGYSYSPWDDLSGIYAVTDASEYPRRVVVELIASDNGQSDGTGCILGFDRQLEGGEIKPMCQVYRIEYVAEDGDGFTTFFAMEDSAAVLDWLNTEYADLLGGKTLTADDIGGCLTFEKQWDYIFGCN